ncbi:MAG: DUF454 domain-containing protein [Erysipelothrix sp.]|nr:DUF454 domain-containing protein [Erysipelothrix sp.]
MRLLYLIAGFLFLSIGAIGTIIPVLPTTPFLLLATACFSKSSPRFNLWFTNTKLYKNNIESFVKHRSMTLKTKLQILALASTMLLLAIFFMDNIYGRFAVVCIIIFKYYYFFFRIHTIPEEIEL